MNRLRKLAQELVAKYPNLFSADFERNKHALAQVSTIHSTSVRNQLAGAITSHVRDNLPQGKTIQVTSEESSESAETEDEKEGNPQITRTA